MAGADGRGGISYIGAVFARDRDHDTAWNASSDGTLERRDYYLQNWRRDVIALVTDAGEQVEQVEYWPYGAPEGFPTGDVNKDGTTDTADEDAIRDAINNNDYYASADLDYDSDVDSADVTIAQNNSGASLGRGELSDVGNRFGYTGHEYENALGDAAPLWHARNRVLNSGIGRWLTRDPAREIDGANLYEYVTSSPVFALDSHGLTTTPIRCCEGWPCEERVEVCNYEVHEIAYQGLCTFQDMTEIERNIFRCICGSDAVQTWFHRTHRGIAETSEGGCQEPCLCHGEPSAPPEELPGQWGSCTWSTDTCEATVTYLRQITIHRHEGTCWKGRGAPEWWLPPP